MKIKLDPIAQEHLEQTLASRGYQLIQQRIRDVMAAKVRELRQDKDHYETAKLRGFLEGVQTAAAVGEVLLHEAKSAKANK